MSMFRPRNYNKEGRKEKCESTTKEYRVNEKK